MSRSFESLSVIVVRCPYCPLNCVDTPCRQHLQLNTVNLFISVFGNGFFVDISEVNFCVRLGLTHWENEKYWWILCWSICESCMYRHNSCVFIIVDKIHIYQSEDNLICFTCEIIPHSLCTPLQLTRGLMLVASMSSSQVMSPLMIAFWTKDSSQSVINKWSKAFIKHTGTHLPLQQRIANGQEGHQTLSYQNLHHWELGYKGNGNLSEIRGECHSSI